MPRYHVQINTRLYPSVFIFHGARRYPGNEAMHSHSALCVLTHIVVAKRISVRLWMKDLFSQCTCVHMYVRMYVSVTLRNVNLWYCLGMSIWGRWSHPGRISDTTCIAWRRWDDVFWRQRTGRTAWLGLCNICICKCRSKCSTQPTASDSDKE